MRDPAIIAVKPGVQPLSRQERREIERREDRIEGGIACLICFAAVIAVAGIGLIWFFS